MSFKMWVRKANPPISSDSTIEQRVKNTPPFLELDGNDAINGWLGLMGSEGWIEVAHPIVSFERTILHPVKVSPVVKRTHPEALNVFKDSYLVEFLELSEGHGESAIR